MTSTAMTANPTLRPLDWLVGRWITEMTHPALPGVVVHGTASIEWLEGERFLIHRARTDHADFPDSISVIGHMGYDRVDSATGKVPDSTDEPGLRMHYFDSRGVFRVYEASIDDASWRLSRDDPGFPQRFVGTLSDGGDTIVGRWQLRRDGGQWADDLEITYRRQR